MNVSIHKNVIDGVIYKPIHINDRAKLVSFFDSLSDKTKSLFSPHPFSLESVDKILDGTIFPNQYVCFVSEKEEDIVGYAFLKFSRFRIIRKIRECLNIIRASLGIAVTDAYHGENIGSNLLKYMIDVSKKELNLRKIVLTVYKDNTRAINFYLKHGFRIYEEVKDKVTGKAMLSMQLDLIDHSEGKP